MPELLTLNDAAARLHISRRTLERWISLGTGPIVTKIGVRRRGILMSDLSAWLARQPRIGVTPEVAQ